MGAESSIVAKQRDALAAVGCMPHILPNQSDGTICLKAIDHALNDEGRPD